MEENNSKPTIVKGIDLITPSIHLLFLVILIVLYLYRTPSTILLYTISLTFIYGICTLPHAFTRIILHEKDILFIGFAGIETCRFEIAKMHGWEEERLKGKNYRAIYTLYCFYENGYFKLSDTNNRYKDVKEILTANAPHTPAKLTTLNHRLHRFYSIFIVIAIICAALSFIFGGLNVGYLTIFIIVTIALVFSAVLKTLKPNW